jgi:hypothetical protein
VDFSDSVGVELSNLLERRASEQLSKQSDFDRLTAMLGAALIVVAEVLRAPLEQGQDADPLIDFTSRWLRTLLKPVTDKNKTQS